MVHKDLPAGHMWLSDGNFTAFSWSCCRISIRCHDCLWKLWDTLVGCHPRKADRANWIPWLRYFLRQLKHPIVLEVNHGKSSAMGKDSKGRPVSTLKVADWGRCTPLRFQAHAYQEKLRLRPRPHQSIRDSHLLISMCSMLFPCCSHPYHTSRREKLESLNEGVMGVLQLGDNPTIAPWEPWEHGEHPRARPAETEQGTGTWSPVTVNEGMDLSFTKPFLEGPPTILTRCVNIIKVYTDTYIYIYVYI